MSGTRSRIATAMTETSGCVTMSRRITLDDQQVVMGRSGGPVQQVCGFGGARHGVRFAPVYAQRNQFPVNRGFLPSKLPHANTGSAQDAPMRCRPDVIPLCSSCQR